MDCDAWVDNSRAVAATLGVVGFLVLLVVPLTLIVRARGFRRPLAFTWVAAWVFAPLAWGLSPRLLHASPGELAWVPLAMAAGLGLGFVVARVEQRPATTFAVVGALGGAGALGILVVLLTAVLAILGTCLD